MKENVNFMIVEDEYMYSNMYKEIIESSGFNVVGIEKSGRGALELVRNKDVDIAIMDIELEGAMDGIECAHILTRNYNVPSIFVSAYDDDEIIEEATETNPLAYLIKPVKMTDLRSLILLSVQNLKREPEKEEKKDNINLKKEVTEIIIGRYDLKLKEEKLYVDGYDLYLTKKEYKVIELFFLKANEIVTYEMIEKYVWGDEEMNKNSLINIIGSLRNKCEYLDILNYNGSGYYLDV